MMVPIGVCVQDPGSLYMSGWSTLSCSPLAMPHKDAETLRSTLPEALANSNTHACTHTHGNIPYLALDERSATYKEALEIERDD